MIQNQAARILSNIARLGVSLVIGLILIRSLLDVGQNAYALYVMVVAGFGLGQLVRETLRVSLVAHLGEAQANVKDDPDTYRTVLGEAFAIASVAAAVAGLIMLGLVFAVQHYGYGGADTMWARAYLLTRTVFVIAAIMVYPALMTVLVRRQQPRLNLILTCERIIELAALLIAVAAAGQSAEVRQLALFGTIFTIAILALYALVLVLQMGRDILARPQFVRPSFSLLRKYKPSLWAGMRDIIAPLMYLRFDLIVLFGIFGPPAAAIFGLAIQITGYIRQMALATVGGLDAVFANVRFAKNGTGPSELFVINVATTVQSLVVFFGFAYVALVLDDLLNLWLGARLDAYGWSQDDLIAIVIIIAPGMLANSLSQGWTTMLTGAGHLPQFVSTLIACALLNPILVIGTLVFVNGPLSTILIYCALWFSILNLGCYGFLVPRYVAQVLNCSIARVYEPFVVPLIGASIAASLAWGIVNKMDEFGLLMITLIFALCFALTALWCWRCYR